MMGAQPASHWLVWIITGAATAGVILRPFSWPEFVWAVAGAALLVCLGLLSPTDALAGGLRGTDVILFLAGMMVLSELARQEGLFDWLAARTARKARGSAARLFSLIFAVGTLVTVLLSNDATAVVLTPAVAAVAKAAKAADPLPYVLICAFVANAASFVLPISNPANLVIYGSRMPPLLQWLPAYALPSVLSIGTTYVALRLTQRRRLTQPICRAVAVPTLSLGGKMAALGICATAIVLLGCSSSGMQLGLATFLAGAATAALVLVTAKRGALSILRSISWGVLPLVAGLFVLVEALEKTGVTGMLGHGVHKLDATSPARAAWITGAALAIGSNLMNNLPAGLVAGRVAEAAQVPDHVRSALLIGIDVGPNLSVTGSLATILWLAALRREGLGISAWAFLKLGIVIMPPALLLAIAGLFAFR